MKCRSRDSEESFSSDTVSAQVLLRVRSLVCILYKETTRTDEFIGLLRQNSLATITSIIDLNDTLFFDLILDD